MEKRAFLFDLNPKLNVYKKPQLKMKFKTVENPNGIGCLVSTFRTNYVVIPGTTDTTVQIYDTMSDTLRELELKETPTVLSANPNANVFAHTDSAGKVIKLRNLEDGSLIKSYNRGKDEVEVTSIIFDEY